jgi:tRNA-splicing ligase RtcB
LHHFGTQGDGNHFFYVGRLKSSGETVIVTHHGSRKPGAMLYKHRHAGCRAHTRTIAAGMPKHQSWIVADTTEGREYWASVATHSRMDEAKSFRAFTTRSQRMSPPRIEERFWNEHNFVWQKSDGLFYHGKGATPAFPNFAADTNGLTLIPMNMAEPILIARGLNAERSRASRRTAPAAI